MKINEAGLELIKNFEGFSNSPYLDPVGIPTIGFGSIWNDDGSPVTMEQSDLDEKEAERFLRREVHHIEKSIKRLIQSELTSNMFSSLCSFTYNVGTGALQRSTIRMKLNRGWYEAAADEFPKWRKAGGRVLQGLVRRRIAERALFEAM
jgi:lysozyme|tara:strand:+ start:968 stop:1414 length:447 start_codon:yes stop_codon:yes gene_type:complete